ncbi:MAG: gliding motility-associated C-terminal domain-containing protein [Aureispira sp.]
MKFSLILLLTTLLLGGSQLTNAQCTIDDIEVKDTLILVDPIENTPAFHVQAKNIKEVKLLVYSRMGKKIFESSSSIISASADAFKAFDTGWDGTLEGKRLSEGLYVYMLEAQCADRSTVRKSGTIILTNQLVP